MVGIENLCGKKRIMTDKIFVSIPTLNDSEYLNTIERAFDEASNPDNIIIGTSIFWRDVDIKNNKIPFFYMFEKKIKKISKNIKYDILYWNNYPGVGFGRIEPLKHFNNEKYYLSLDSHTYFSNNWDENLIDIYQNSKKHFGKRVLITTYLASYINNNNKYINGNSQEYKKNFYNVKVTEKNNIFYLKNQNFSKWQYFNYYGTIGLQEQSLNDKYFFPVPDDIDPVENFNIFNHLINNEYLPAKKLSAHFIFTESYPWIHRYRLCLDPRIRFWGEEFYQSVLAYARGYNFAWIKTPIFFHFYGGDIKEKDTFDGKVDKFTREVMESDLNEFKNKEEKLYIFNKYINNTKKTKNDTYDRYVENNIISILLKNDSYFGYLSRGIKSYLNYAKIDLYNQKCSPWDEVPKLNVIYK